MNFEGVGCLEIVRKSSWKGLNLSTLHRAAPHSQLAASPKCNANLAGRTGHASVKQCTPINATILTAIRQNNFTKNHVFVGVGVD